MKPDLEALVLGALKDGPKHGYAITRLIRGEGEVLKAGEGQLYPVLHRLEEDGFVEGEWVPQEGRPARKVYSLTDKGTGLLEKKRRAFVAFRHAVEGVLGLPPDGSKAVLGEGSPA